MVELEHNNTPHGDTTTDSLLLADFVTVKPKARVLEIGTGNGAIALILAERHNVDALGTDISPVSIHKARANAERNKNTLTGTVRFQAISAGDMLTDAWRERFDAVVANPPFYPAGTGRVPPSQQRKAARHEITLSLHTLLSTASHVLVHKGKFFCIHLPARLDELLATCTHYRLAVRNLQPVYTAPGKPARRILVMAQKGVQQDISIEPPRKLY